jgi:hypothetical protein
MSTRLISAGVQQAWLAFVGNDKNMITGASSTAPAPGAAVSHALPLRGVQTVPSGLPESEVVAVLGDDRVLGSFDFESETPTSFVINTGEVDLERVAQLQGTLVETIGEIELGLLRPSDVQLPDICLVVNARAKRTGEGGASGWQVYIYPRLTLRPLGRETFAGREAATYRYQASVQTVENKPWGTTFTAAANGATSADVIELSTLYPIAMFAFTGNGTVTTFTGLERTPAGAAHAIYALNAVQQTSGYSFNATNKTFSTTTPPANNAKGVVFYGYK